MPTDLNQITVNVNDIIPPDNFATVDVGSKIGTVYTKAQNNEWRAEVEATTQSGIKGVLKPNTPYDPVTNPYPTPWTPGDSPLYEKYDINQAGPFPNTTDASDENIFVTQNELDLNEVQIWIKNGVAEKLLKAMPQASVNIINWSDIPSGDFPKTEGFQSVHENNIWVVAEGQTVSSTDVPGASSKWVIISSKITSSVGKNLFNKNTMVFDGLININSISNPAGFKYAKIPIEELIGYKVNQIPLINWFLVQDANGNNIPNPTPGEGGNYRWSMEEFSAGRFTGVAGARFLLVNVTHPTAPEEGVDLDTFQVEKGDFTTEYEPYTLYLKSVNNFQVPEIPQMPNENYIDLDVIALGDSITEQVGEEGWVDQMLKNMSFKSFKRYARSGAMWTNFGGTNDDPLDTANPANNTISHQFQRAIKDYNDGVINAPRVAIILAGVNDARELANSGRPLGTIEGAFPSYNAPILQRPVGEINTMTEAIRFNIERIWQKFPNCQVIIATPSQTGNPNLYRVKEARDLIIECGLRMSVQVIDQYAKNGIYGGNEVGSNHIDLRDNLHYTVKGAKKAALFLMQQFKLKMVKFFSM